MLGKRSKHFRGGRRLILVKPVNLHGPVSSLYNEEIDLEQFI